MFDYLGTAPEDAGVAVLAPNSRDPEAVATGPSCNSHDRQVVVADVINDLGGPQDRQESCRPFGPRYHIEDVYPDLTVGAITSRRFAPVHPVATASGSRELGASTATPASSGAVPR